jgi:hypothetical protein
MLSPLETPSSSQAHATADLSMMHSPPGLSATYCTTRSKWEGDPAVLNDRIDVTQP